MSGRLALGALLVGAGVVWLLAATDVIDISYRTAIGLALLAIGLALVLVRRGVGLLVVLGILVAVAALPALLIDRDLLTGGVGKAIERPETRTELEPFRHGIGKLTVDLTAPDLDLDGATVEASIGIGELVVLIPDDTDVTVDIDVGIGNAEALGRTESGLGVGLSGISGTSGAQELDLELDAGIGNVRVQQR